MTEENLAEKNPAFSFCPSGKFRFAKPEKIGTALGRFRVFKYAEILKRRNGNFQKLGKIEKHMREIPILGNVFLTGRNDARFILAPLPEEMRFSKHGNSGGAPTGKTHFQKRFIPGDHPPEIIVFQYRENLAGRAREKVIFKYADNLDRLKESFCNIWKFGHRKQEKPILENAGKLSRLAGKSDNRKHG